MTSNTKLALILGGVVLISIVAIAMMKQKTDSGVSSQTSAGSSSSSGFVPAPIDPNLPEWAKTTTALINTAGQVGTSALNVKNQYDLQRQSFSGAKPLAGYSYSISA